MVVGNELTAAGISLLAGHFVGSFQIVPAAVINRNIAQGGQMLPKEGEEGLLMLLLAHAHSGINIKATGVHLLHHGVDNSAAPSTTPALKDNNNGLFGLPGHALHLAQTLTQHVHHVIIVALGQLFLHIQLFQHTKSISLNWG